MKRTIGLALLLGAALLGRAQDMPKPPSMEDRLRHTKEVIEKEVPLNAVQQKQLILVYSDFFTQIDKLHKDAPPPPTPPPPPPPPPMDPKMKEQFEKLVKERDEKMKTVLTDDQYKKYLEAVKNLHPHHHGEGDKNMPPPPPPPAPPSAPPAPAQ